MSNLYLKFFIGSLALVIAAILHLCVWNTNSWSFPKVFSPRVPPAQLMKIPFFQLHKQKNLLRYYWLHSLIPHIEFISKSYWLCFQNIPKADDFSWPLHYLHSHILPELLWVPPYWFPCYCPVFPPTIFKVVFRIYIVDIHLKKSLMNAWISTSQLRKE